MSSSPEVIEAIAEGNGHSRRRRYLIVGAAALVGLLVLAVLVWRTVTTESNDEALCKKIDRFVVAIETSVVSSDTLTPAEKADRLAFYETFRNDPPVCRTAPAPKVAGE